MRVAPRSAARRLALGALAIFSASAALAFGKPDWARPYLDLPTPRGEFIATSDTWVVVWGEVELSSAGGGRIASRHRLVLECTARQPETFSLVVAHDPGREDVRNMGLFVQRTIWREINLERKASRARAGETEILAVSAERIEPGRRVALEYEVVDRLGLSPWSVLELPRAEPIARIVVRAAPSSAVRMRLVVPEGVAAGEGVRTEVDGSVVAEGVPARHRISPLGAAFQPVSDQLLPHVEVWLDEPASATFAGYAALYRGKWLERLAAIDRAQVRAIGAGLVVEAATPAARAARLAAFVQREIQYDASNMGSADAWLPLASEEVLRSRRGDCKGKVMLLQALLETVGIESAPVLMRAGRRYFTWGDAPASARFNHVILAVKLPLQEPVLAATLLEGPARGWVVVDPTVTTAAFGAALPGHEGLPALLIGEAAQPVFTIRTHQPSIEAFSATLRIDLEADGTCRGTLGLTDNGLAPIVGRLSGAVTGKEVTEAVRDLLMRRYPQARVTSSQIVQAGGDHPAARLEASFEVPACAQEMSTTVLLPSPLGVVASLAGLPAGLAPAVPPRPDDAITLKAPWATRLNVTGSSSRILAEVTLRLPPTVRWTPGTPVRHARSWLGAELGWETLPDGSHRATLRLDEPRGAWDAAERRARLQLVDELYTSLFTPLVLTRTSPATKSIP